MNELNLVDSRLVANRAFRNRSQENKAENIIGDLAMRWLKQITAFVLIATFLQSSELGVLNADEPVPNAALEHWTAFALIPNVSSSDSVKIDSTTSDNPTYGFAVPVRSEFKQFFLGSGEQALARLQRASEFSYCTWGTDLRNNALRLTRKRRISWHACRCCAHVGDLSATCGTRESTT